MLDFGQVAWINPAGEDVDFSIWLGLRVARDSTMALTATSYPVTWLPL
jgi:hypothetical protein